MPEPVLEEVALDGRTVLVATAPERGGSTAGSTTVMPSFGEYPVYDDTLYEIMTGDAVRHRAFMAALERTVPGKRVLDLGTGSHLTWAREAVELGAASVIGVESMTESVAAARRLRRRCGLGDRIELVHGTSTCVDLAEPADVCVAEVIGSMAGAEGAAAVVRDARQRLLSAACVVVPHRAATRVAAACLQEVLTDHPVAFSAPAVPFLRKIFRWNGGPFDVRLRVTRPRWDSVLTGSAEVEVLELNGDLRTEQNRTVELVVDRHGGVDGLLAWMRLWASPESAPIDTRRDETNWAAVYLPVFEETEQCRPGDVLRIAFHVRLAADRIHPVYDVDALLTRDGRTIATGHHTSNFGGRSFRRQVLYRTLFPL